MNRQFLISGIFLIFLAVGCQAAPADNSVTHLESAGASAPAVVEEAPAPQPDVSRPSCAEPTPEIMAGCRARANAILASTVRIELRHVVNDGQGEATERGSSLATLQNGRTLITHNHFSAPLLDVPDGETVLLTIHTAAGETIFTDLRLATLDVRQVGLETLALDFGQTGETLFAAFGLVSAEFDAVSPAQLTPGTEVAQADWDGQSVHVDWVPVEAAAVEDGVPQVDLTNSQIQGASGGGVFLNGRHIANNWMSVGRQDLQTGAELHRFSVAALNELPLVAAGG